MKFLFSVFSIIMVLMTFESCNRCRYGCENGRCIKRECRCDTYWDGDACEKSYLKRYEGTYVGSNSCGPPSQVWEFGLTVSSDPSVMNVGSDFQLQFTDSSRFEILEQEFDGHTVSGEGQMLIESISFYYEWSDSIAAYHCLVEAHLWID
ncbi:MAG: hypothetical protein R2813_11615 [Flavobacteriales bacterium]